MMLAPVADVTEADIESERPEIEAEDARISNGGVSNACQLAIDLEMLIEERAKQIGKGAGVVIRAALARVTGRALARRYDTPGECFEQIENEFWKAKRHP